MTKIKICGLKRLEDINYVNELLPEYIGFVFAKSKRQIDIKSAWNLKNKLSHIIKPVGVFVNEDKNFIKKLSDEKIIELVQLHGDEDKDYIISLKKMIEIPIIKAIRVRNEQDIISAQKLPCDYLLLDTFVENEAGGSGRAFNHEIIPPLIKPFFLAGGLNPQNVNTAIDIASPYAVDVSSGVEETGVKSMLLIKEFIDNIREKR